MESSKKYNKTFVQSLNRPRIYDRITYFQSKKAEICENVEARFTGIKIIIKNEKIEEIYQILQIFLPEKGEKFWKVCRNPLIQELGIYAHICKEENIDPEVWWLAQQEKVSKNHINQILYCFSKARCCLERRALG